MKIFVPVPIRCRILPSITIHLLGYPFRSPQILSVVFFFSPQIDPSCTYVCLPSPASWCHDPYSNVETETGTDWLLHPRKGHLVSCVRHRSDSRQIQLLMYYSRFCKLYVLICPFSGGKTFTRFLFTIQCINFVTRLNWLGTAFD